MSKLSVRLWKLEYLSFTNKERTKHKEKVEKALLILDQCRKEVLTLSQVCCKCIPILTFKPNDVFIKK